MTADMPTVVRSEKPIYSDKPAWFNSQGFEMTAEKFDTRNREDCLEISGNESSIDVTWNFILYDDSLWLHDNPKPLAKFVQSVPPNSQILCMNWIKNQPLGNSRGGFYFRSDELIDIFNLENDSNLMLNDERFVRNGNYLGIKYAGVSEHGKVNVCVYLSDAIKTEIENLSLELQKINERRRG